jgi:hypothetical protein
MNPCLAQQKKKKERKKRKRILVQIRAGVATLISDKNRFFKNCHKRKKSDNDK